MTHGSDGAASARFIHFDPHNPPDAIVELDAWLGELGARINEMRVLFAGSPLNVEWLENATGWSSYAIRITEGVLDVADLADDEAVTS